ncbi:hypothetical protein P154DRAFT_445923 [Amniculicola lignicola CBS 123094]|uniref:Uncharacterized protein n=1 Tax=Amniculicola lignicola CBS 123094 TaxID=1392246 RepID=A0A6A5W0J3_9PLEO|nr:hypothetical protein P154DRAFT_445923 [Amniculicola lignicola CBS 123094]
MADDDIPGVCDACEVECRADVACNCGMEFCSSHWARHQMKHPTHRKAASGKVAKLWDWVKGNVNNLKSSTARAARFEKDEGSKWFGFVVESFGAERTTSILETARFSMLMEGSMLSSDEGPTSRYPSIVSFVGECGAGKSTLIRALVSYATPSNGGMQDLDVPIPGAQSGPDALVATTGEVNLYPDPSSFGTETPRLYADCEGLFGGEPCAAKHQWRWREHGRRYPLAEKKDGKMVDRRTAVQTIYPRFLYMFSDVICLVTRNPKRWADEAVQLLQWASVGAHHTVNQYALPAAIIILNGPHSEDPVWVSDDLGYLTRQFFKNVNGEMETNSVLQEMATKHGVNTLEDLFSRNFSSVYVHFVPHDQSKLLGSPDIILQQHERLFYRLKADTARVQVERERSWTKFDSKQISVLFHYVFKHLANHSDEPFDFSSCRRQVSLPQTVQGHLSEFLQLSLGNSLGENFAYASKMVASYLCQNASREEGRGE